MAIEKEISGVMGNFGRSAVPCFALEKQGHFVRMTSVFQAGTFLYPQWICPITYSLLPKYTTPCPPNLSHFLCGKELGMWHKSLERGGTPDSATLPKRDIISIVRALA